MTKVEYGYGPSGQYGQTVTYDFGGYQTKTFTPINNFPNTYTTQTNYNSGGTCSSDIAFRERCSREMAEKIAYKSELLNAVKNGEDWHAAADNNEKVEHPNPDTQRHICNDTYLLSIREALKNKNYDVALDISRYCGRRIDENYNYEKGFVTLCLAVEQGYDDIYFFLIDTIKNPRAMSPNSGFNLLDWLDQGVSYYGDNESYQRIKKDLKRFGLKIHGRKETTDFPFCCSIS